MSHIEKIKKQMQEVRTLVVDMCGIDEEQLNELIFNYAYEWLRQTIGHDQFGMQHLPRTGQFWAWWKMEWHKLDQELLFNDQDGILQYSYLYNKWFGQLDKTYHINNAADMWQFYKHYHAPENHNFHINTVVLQSYRNLILKNS
jgi:hypothetical protein